MTAVGASQTGDAAVTLFQPQKATTTWQCERYFRLHPFGFYDSHRCFSIHKKPVGFEWRLTGPRRTVVVGGNIKPDSDLSTLIVLLIGDLVPVGVVADRLQEEYPEMEAACVFLREWEEHKRYAKIVDPIVDKK